MMLWHFHAGRYWRSSSRQDEGLSGANLGFTGILFSIFTLQSQTYRGCLIDKPLY